MNEDFVRERITALRLKKGVSEYQMSYDLGHSRGYIYNISSGKALPPLKEFFAICDYFGLTPAQFFDEGTQNPELIQKAVSGMKQLNEAVTNPKFEVYTDKAGEFRFRLKAKNGEIIAVGEGYKTKASCLNGIDSIRRNAPEASVEKVES